MTMMIHVLYRGTIIVANELKIYSKMGFAACKHD